MHRALYGVEEDGGYTGVLFSAKEGAGGSATAGTAIPGLVHTGRADWRIAHQHRGVLAYLSQQPRLSRVGP